MRRTRLVARMLIIMLTPLHLTGCITPGGETAGALAPRGASSAAGLLGAGALLGGPVIGSLPANTPGGGSEAPRRGSTVPRSPIQDSINRSNGAFPAVDTTGRPGSTILRDRATDEIIAATTGAGITDGRGGVPPILDLTSRPGTMLVRDPLTGEIIESFEGRPPEIASLQPGDR